MWEALATIKGTQTAHDPISEFQFVCCVSTNHQLQFSQSDTKHHRGVLQMETSFGCRGHFENHPHTEQHYRTQQNVLQTAQECVSFSNRGSCSLPWSEIYFVQHESLKMTKYFLFLSEQKWRSRLLYADDFVCRVLADVFLNMCSERCSKRRLTLNRVQPQATLQRAFHQPSYNSGSAQTK